MDLEHFFSWLDRNYSSRIDDPALLKEIFMDDREFAGSVLQTVVQTVVRYKTVIDDPAVATQDRSFFIAVHSLKSTVASIGMQSMATALQQMELQLKKGERMTHETRRELRENTAQILDMVQQMNKQLNAEI